MAAVRHTRRRSSTAQASQPEAPHSAITSDQASPGLVLCQLDAAVQGLGTDRLDEQRPFAAGFGYNRNFYALQPTAQSAAISTSSLKSQASSTRGITARFRRVGHHLRRLSNELKGGRGAIASLLSNAAGIGRLPNTRSDLPIANSTFADPEQASFAATVRSVYIEFG